MKWEQVQQIHARAAADLAAAAERVPPERWLTPRAEGKWSPAEVVEHLNLTYDVVLKEISGGGGMQIRTKLWQRILLRLSLVPRLLRGEPFPKNARAPREVRPGAPEADQKAAIARFRDSAAKLEALAVHALNSRRRARITHAYFGSASVPDGVLLCARHIQHHYKQMPEAR